MNIKIKGQHKNIRKSISNAQVKTTRMLTPTFTSLLSDVRDTIQKKGKKDKQTPKKQKNIAKSDISEQK